MYYKEHYIPDSFFNNKILHCDLNKFYASVFLLYYPRYRGYPVAVLGSQEDRSGIVLTATAEAKAKGIKTGMVYWQAAQLCPDVLFVPADYDLYMRYSRIMRDVYAQFTDKVEPFGLDECWLDVTHSAHLFGGAEAIATEISRIAREEIGLTLSIGLGWAKTVSKLGSDMKKPDAITVLDPDRWRGECYKLPVDDLLYVGRQTLPKLEYLGIHSIGDLADTPEWVLVERFGKIGTYLWYFANGLDQTPVADIDDAVPIKTIGNSQTAPFDLATREDVLVLFTILAESVAGRMIDHGFKCRGVEVSLRDKDLKRLTRQMHIPTPTCLATDLVKYAMHLYDKHQWGIPMRSVGVRAIDLIDIASPYQITFDCDAEKAEKLYRLELEKHELRGRYGNKKIVLAREMTNPAISHFDIRKSNVVHPVGYLRNTGT